MLVIVKTISTSLDDLKRRIIKVCRYGKSDIQTSVEVSPYGVDSNPIKDMVAVYAPTKEKGKTVILGYFNKNKLAEVGEYRNFSTDEEGNVVFYTHLKNDGTMEIGGDSDFMVRYSALETGFNQLKSDFNTFITSQYNLHIHPTPAGPSSPTVLVGTPSTADISGAKIQEIKTL